MRDGDSVIRWYGWRNDLTGNCVYSLTLAQNYYHMTSDQKRISGLLNEQAEIISWANGLLVWNPRTLWPLHKQRPTKVDMVSWYWVIAAGCLNLSYGKAVWPMVSNLQREVRPHSRQQHINEPCKHVSVPMALWTTFISTLDSLFRQWEL